MIHDAFSLLIYTFLKFRTKGTSASDYCMQMNTALGPECDMTPPLGSIKVTCGIV